jgi:hypothetical protein
MLKKSAVIVDICYALSDGLIERAASLVRNDYTFVPSMMAQRKYGAVESTRVFMRDGFIDRYTGEKLIFPPVLRILSALLPAEFPYHPNWKTDVTHPAYWELSATVDHLVPISRGGLDEESNWITTSMARNSAKMNWTLEELGWKLQDAGNIKAWDGLLHWFLDYVAAHPGVIVNASLRRWHRAAKVVIAVV